MIIIGLSGSLAQQHPRAIPPLFNTELNQSVGVLFEEISQLRTFESEWEVLTYINLTTFKTDQIEFKNAIQKLIEFCNDIYPSYKYMELLLNGCGPIIEGYQLVLLEMEDFSHEYFLSTPKIKRGVLNRINNLKSFYHNSIREDKEIIYLDNLKKLASVGKYRIMDPHNKITYLQSVMNIQANETENISNHIKTLKSQVQALEDNLMSLKQNHTKGAQFVINKIHDTIAFSISLILNFQYKLRQTLALLPSKYNKNNSPDIISPKVFLAELQNVSNTVYHSGLELPFDAIEENLPFFYEITEMKASIVDDQLILRFAVPLVYSLPMKLYKVNPYPFKIIKNIYAFIFPESDYFAVDRHINRYIPISDEQLKECYNMQSLIICRLNTPTVYAKGINTCTIDLLQKSSDLSACEIRLTKFNSDIWIKMYKPNTWLYIVPETRIVYAKCYQQETQTVRFESTGIMTLQKTCRAETNGIIISANDVEETQVSIFIPDSLSTKKVMTLIVQDMIENLETYDIPHFNFQFIDKHNIHRLLHHSLNILNLPKDDKIITKHVIMKTRIDFFPAIIFCAITLIIFILVNLIIKYTSKTAPTTNTPSRPVSIGDISFL